MTEMPEATDCRAEDPGFIEAVPAEAAVKRSDIKKPEARISPRAHAKTALLLLWVNISRKKPVTAYK